MPPWQTVPAAQRLPHMPQLRASDCPSTHSSPQVSCDAAQTRTHMPARQPCPLRQGKLQRPQL